MKTKTRLLLPAFLIFLTIVGTSIGGFLWYDSHVDRSGWFEKDGTRFYQDFYGDPVSGWLELETGRYKFVTLIDGKEVWFTFYVMVEMKAYG